MLDGYIAEDPGTEYDHGLEDGEEMRLQVKRRHIEMRTRHRLRTEARAEERNGEDQCRYTDAEREYIHYPIIPQGDLLADVIKAQTNRRYES